jgi:hypothetical protein
MSFVPMTLSATAGVSPHEAGLASGFINTTRQVGGALGRAVMATIATTIATDHALRGIGPDCRLSGGVRHRRVRSGDRCPLGSRPAEIVSRYRESAHGGSRGGRGATSRIRGLTAALDQGAPGGVSTELAADDGPPSVPLHRSAGDHCDSRHPHAGCRTSSLISGDGCFAGRRRGHFARAGCSHRFLSSRPHVKLLLRVR